MKVLIERLQKAVAKGTGAKLTAAEASYVVDQLNAPRMSVGGANSDRALAGILVAVVNYAKRLHHSDIVRVGCLLTTRTYVLLALEQDQHPLNELFTTLIKSGSHPHDEQSVTEILTWLSQAEVLAKSDDGFWWPGQQIQLSRQMGLFVPGDDTCRALLRCRNFSRGDS